MIGHTGFLVSSRRAAPGVKVPQRKRRPAKGAYPVEGEWSAEDLGERMVSDRKIRRVTRAQAKDRRPKDARDGKGES
jgi:tRNA (adenine57-N1/adenine58-N1)-methyltransferase